MEKVQGLTEEKRLKFLELVELERASFMRALIEKSKKGAGGSFVAIKKALAAARSQNGTTEGRRAYETILTAAVYDGDKPQAVTTKRRAELLGVDVEVVACACERAKRLRSDIHPDEAIKQGVYWYQERAKKSDATSPEPRGQALEGASCVASREEDE